MKPRRLVGSNNSCKLHFHPTLLPSDIYLPITPRLYHCIRKPAHHDTKPKPSTTTSISNTSRTCNTNISNPNTTRQRMLGKFYVLSQTGIVHAPATTKPLWLGSLQPLPQAGPPSTQYWHIPNRHCMHTGNQCRLETVIRSKTLPCNPAQTLQAPPSRTVHKYSICRTFLPSWRHSVHRYE